MIVGMAGLARLGLPASEDASEDAPVHLESRALTDRSRHRVAGSPAAR